MGRDEAAASDILMSKTHGVLVCSQRYLYVHLFVIPEAEYNGFITKKKTNKKQKTK